MICCCSNKDNYLWKFYYLIILFYEWFDDNYNSKKAGKLTSPARRKCVRQYMYKFNKYNNILIQKRVVERVIFCNYSFFHMWFFATTLFTTTTSGKNHIFPYTVQCYLSTIDTAALKYDRFQEEFPLYYTVLVTTTAGTVYHQQDYWITRLRLPPGLVSYLK